MVGREAWLVRWKDHSFQAGAIEKSEDLTKEVVWETVGFIAYEDEDLLVLAGAVELDPGESFPADITRLLKPTIISMTRLRREGE